MEKQAMIMDPDGVIREITPLTNRDCFYVADRRIERFTYPMHFHDEYELNFCEHAAGARRVVGDSEEVIDEYDLVLISGSNLEHMWEQHECKSKEIREITIQFSPSFITDNMLNKNLFVGVKRMLERGRLGLCFPQQAVLKVYHLLDRLVAPDRGFHVVLDMLEMLYELSLFEDARTLSSSSFAKIEMYSDSRRVQRVQRYISEHFKEEIRLQALADMVDMTPVSFSRFFHMRTGTTLSEYLIDIRIGAAARLLVDTSHTIAEICYECGFTNLSNFNRLFKRKKECSPREFRENFKKKRIVF